jgi:CoA:oxalate CoA-transferase
MNSPNSLIDKLDTLPLSGLRVVELTQRFSGPLCGLLLAELGADVVKVEPPSGDPMRRKLRRDGQEPGQKSGQEYGPAYAAINRGKRIVTLDLKTPAGHAALLDLVSGADAFVTNMRPAALLRRGLDPQSLRPGLIYASLSGAGWDPEAGDIGLDDAAAQAETGFMFATGWPDDGPVVAPFPLAAASSALFGAIGILAAYAKGTGVAIDAAMVDTLSACMEFPLMHAATFGQPSERNGGRHPTAAPSQIYAAGSGGIAIMATSPGEFERLARALDRPELASDPRFIDNDARMAHRGELTTAIESILSTNDSAYWFAHLAEAGVACAPVQSIAEAISHPRFKGRRTVRSLELSSGPIDVIAYPGGRVRRGAADAGAPVNVETASIGWDARAAQAAPPAAPGTLLEGVKVVDLTRFLSGPFATAILADLGADVLKVEAPGGDPTRAFRPKIDGKSGYFASVNRGKRAMALDLKSADGLEMVKREIATADILIDNFRPGVMARLGLSDAELQRINPSLVAVSISGFGQDGELAECAAYDMTVQAFSGLMRQNGYAASGPTRLGVSIGDIGTAMFAALAALAGLGGLRRNGIRAPRIDVAMVDSLLALMEQLVVANSVGRPVQEGLGGYHAAGSPMGAFPVGDGHVYLAAGSDRDFPVLAAVLGVPQLPEDPRFATAEDRLNNRDQLSEVIAQLIQSETMDGLVARLREAGVIAAAVRRVEDAVASPLMRRRNLFQPCGPFQIVRLPLSEIGKTPGGTPTTAPL